MPFKRDGTCLLSRTSPDTNYQSGFSKKQSLREVLHVASLLRSVIPGKPEWGKWRLSQEEGTIGGRITKLASTSHQVWLIQWTFLWEAFWTIESQESWMEGRVVKIVFTGFQSHYLNIRFHGRQLPHTSGLSFGFIPPWQQVCSRWATRGTV